MTLAWLLLLVGLTISAVAIYYSVIGLAAIFSAAVIPIIVMGSSLEVAKLVCASWLKANWDKAPRFMKYYMITAVAVLMLITSMGIFGFLSKAHNDQNLVSGDVQSKIAIYDEKIKIAKENIDANRKALKQLDEAVDQVMARSTSETGADKSVAIRKSQSKERTRLLQDITSEQKNIAKLNEERAPIAAEIRKVEAEVGPIKYIAKFVYGEDSTNENMLEKAVTWVIILIVVVFDPLAVIMLLAAQMTFGWTREQTKDEEHPPYYVADVGERPAEEEKADDFLPTYEEITPQPDDAEEKRKMAEEYAMATAGGPPHHPDTHPYLRQGFKVPDNYERISPMVAKPEEMPELEVKVLEGEEALQALKTAGIVTEEGNLAPEYGGEETITDVERPGDYLTADNEDVTVSTSTYQILPELEEESKKKTYMIKDHGHQVTKTKE